MSSARGAIAGALIFFACGSVRAAALAWPEFLEQADELLREGKYAPAAAAARGALADADASLRPDAPEMRGVLVRVGRICAEAQDDAEIPRLERRLSALGTKDYDDWLVLGRLLLREGRSREAEDALEKALALKPGDPDAESRLADAYDALGRYDDEARLLNKIIEIAPGDYVQYPRLADVYIRAGRTALARETYARARRVAGKAAKAYIEEGYFELRSGEPAQAREDFESAIAVDTASPFGYHHLGSYFLRTKRFPEAEKYFRLALARLEADPGAHDTGIHEEDRVHTLDYLGDAIQAQGRSAEAEAVYRRCLETPVPRQIYAVCVRSLAYALDSDGETALAEETVKRVLAVCAAESDCSCRGRALIGLATLSLKHGRGREAAETADRVAKLCAETHDPKITPVFMELANLRRDLGDASRPAAPAAK